MKYAFTIYKLDSETYAFCWAQSLLATALYGIHITGDNPKVAYSYVIPDTYLGGLKLYEIIHAWIMYYHEEILKEPFDKPASYLLNNLIFVADNKEFDVEKEYRLT